MTVFELIARLEAVENKTRDVLVIDPDGDTAWLDIVEAVEGPHGVMLKTSAS